MGLMNQLYTTYCAMEQKYVGNYAECAEPLVPISHQIINAELEITINAEGKFLSACSVGKENAAIIIPVTEDSAGRTGDNDRAHPLCDQIRYLTPQYPKKFEAYLTQLHHWEDSPYTHPKLHAIARYVEKGTILSDLAGFGLIALNEDGLPVKEKQVVRWRVDSGKDDESSACWKDLSLFQSFIDYYASTKQEAPVFCMASGQYAVPASQHPKKLINLCANAKLISANDTSGFTYRGRFTDDAQAMTMGYETSQKIHNALHWLAANQGVPMAGRMFLCWNPQGIPIPKANASFLRKTSERSFKYSDYQKQLSETLRGWKENLPADAGAVIAAFDAATSGRLSLTYYSEMLASDLAERLHHWDNVCCWEHFPFGVESPDIGWIADCAFGTVRNTKGKGKDHTEIKADERASRQHVQRLLSCRIDKAKMPADIVKGLAEKASNLQIIKDLEMREKVLFTVCAVIRKYDYDWNQEEWNMALEPEKKDISYQYGRLLAVFEKIERDTYDSGEKREPNAIRLQVAFSKQPLAISCMLWEQLDTAYLPKIKSLKKREEYRHLYTEIGGRIAEFPDFEQNRPLKHSYFMGYCLQRNALYAPKNEGNQEEEMK